jgi:hypothetical protein
VGSLVRALREGSTGWETPELKYPSGESYPYRRNEQMEDVLAVRDLIDCPKNTTGPILSGRKASQATGLIFATYESGRRRARIYLLLEIEDSPMLPMLEAGMIGPKKAKPKM